MTLPTPEMVQFQLDEGDPVTIGAYSKWVTQAYADGELITAEECPATAEHQHQFLPWLTLPNGSSWTGCASCDWQYQYDHV